MKKILAAAAMLAAISVGCRADLFNQSDETVGVSGQHGGDTTVNAGDSETFTFRLREQHGSLFPSVGLPHKTTLTVKGRDSKKKKSVEITGKSHRTLTIQPGLQCELDGEGEDRSESKRKNRNRDRDEDRRDEDRDEDQD